MSVKRFCDICHECIGTLIRTSDGDSLIDINTLRVLSEFRIEIHGHHASHTVEVCKACFPNVLKSIPGMSKEDIDMQLTGGPPSRTPL